MGDDPKSDPDISVKDTDKKIVDLASPKPETERVDVNPDTDGDADAEREREDMRILLDSLRTEHRRLDGEINALIMNGTTDKLRIQRMKKIKLSMKDQIAYVQNQLTPDIIA